MAMHSTTDTTGAPADDTPVSVTTAPGDLRGRWRDGVARFAGVPFAAPPVGPRRFRPPAPVDPWQGERDATGFGPVSPQNPSLMDALFGGEAEEWDEDCLYLNVWTTAPNSTTATGTTSPGGGAPGSERLPVMVWIHGGGFEMGSGSSPLYHGERFARAGVVYVSVNYRLGSLGFLELGHLDADYAGSGNVGLLDQVAALEWVRDNIAAFGGDPANVTAFGESAGGMSVSLLLAMPAARGLFHKAIVQSGSTAAAKSPRQAADDCGEFMEATGVAGVADLVDAPVADLLAAHAKMSAGRMANPEDVIRRFGNPLAFLAFRPVADGGAVPAEPLAAIAAGASSGIPLVIGTNLEEWKLFAMMAPPITGVDALLERMKLVSGDPDGALAAYRTDHPDAPPADLEQALLTDMVFRSPACRLADAHGPHAPVWQYRFDWRSPALGGMIGAAHAVEIPFVFDLVEDHRLHVLVGAEAPVGLARGMHEAWVAFAATGEPNFAGLAWPQVGDAGRPVLCLDTETTVQSDPQGVTRRFWDGVDTGA